MEGYGLEIVAIMSGEWAAEQMGFTHRKTAFWPRRKGAVRARPSAAPTAVVVVISR